MVGLRVKNFVEEEGHKLCAEGGVIIQGILGSPQS